MAMCTHWFPSTIQPQPRSVRGRLVVAPPTLRPVWPTGNICCTSPPLGPPSHPYSVRAKFLHPLFPFTLLLPRRLALDIFSSWGRGSPPHTSGGRNAALPVGALLNSRQCNAVRQAVRSISNNFFLTGKWQIEKQASTFPNCEWRLHTLPTKL